jgi:glycosyltransferase involved in cell wall biosynthesis
MDDRLPPVSICIPSYNSEAFIRETILSVLNQSYQNIEIIICDDKSSDRTIEIINDFKDSRIKFIQNENNLGAGGNWNKTLSIASGKYIKLMGADDILFPDCIKEQVNILENPAHADIVLVTSDKEVIDETGKTVLQRKSPWHGTINGLAAIKKCIRSGTNIIGEPVSGLYRKDILTQSGYYRSENLYMIDLDLWSRVLCLGNLFVIEGPLFAFRISRKSLSFKMGFHQYKLFNKFVHELSKEPKFRITQTDVLISRVTSLIMVGIRKVFYLLFL